MSAEKIRCRGLDGKCGRWLFEVCEHGNVLAFSPSADYRPVKIHGYWRAVEVTCRRCGETYPEPVLKRSDDPALE